MNNIYIAQYLGTPPRASRLLDLTERIVRRLAPWIRVHSVWRGMASIESRMNSYHLLSQVITCGIPGDIVEIGCNHGETTVVLQRLLQDLDPTRELHAYDSFSGIPPGEQADEGVYEPGQMSATVADLLAHCDQLNLRRPVVHPGWFDDTLPTLLPDEIAFAMIDADLYRSTLQAVAAVYPRLSSGAICLFGVYWDPDTNVSMTRDRHYKSPGVKKACDEFLSGRPEQVDVLYAGDYTMGFFRKK